jgi:tRNA A37 methylthiotransferase MiaB
MNTLLKQISAENNQKEIWNKRTMIINDIWTDKTLYGYTDNMKQIIITAPSIPAEKRGVSPQNKEGLHQLWDIIPIKITWAGEFKLKGKIIE